MFPQAQLDPVLIVIEAPGPGVPAVGEDQLDQIWVAAGKWRGPWAQMRSRSSGR